jgi:hypothetical protein
MASEAIASAIFQPEASAFSPALCLVATKTTVDTLKRTLPSPSFSVPGASRIET